MKVLLYPALLFIGVTGGYVVSQALDVPHANTTTTVNTEFTVLETRYSSAPSGQSAIAPTRGAGCGI